MSELVPAVAGELEEAKGNAEAEAALRAAHPRFDALQQQYGPMAGAAAAASTGTALSASMIEVCLVCVAPSAGQKMGQQTKKVPSKDDTEPMNSSTWTPS